MIRRKTYQKKVTIAVLGFLLVLAAVAVWHSPASAQAAPEVKVKSSDKDLFIGNGTIERSIMILNGKVQSWSVTNRLAHDSLPPSPEEFAFTLADGTRISSNKFEYVGRVVEFLDAGAKKLIINLRNEDLKIDAQITFTLAPEDFVMRKNVRLRSSAAGGVGIDSLTVEHFVGLYNSSAGGIGQPIYVDYNIFLGLEHPAGHNDLSLGEATLTHYPGWRLGPEWRESMTAVTGVSAPDGVRAQFFRYINYISLNPKPFVLYNSWFDLRAGEMSDEAFLKVAETFDKNLKPYGAGLDSVVIDDGWQKPDSLWDADPKQFPGGMNPLGAELKEKKTALGLWLPLCGYGLNLALNPPDGFEAGPDKRWFCLAGENYRSALKQRLAQLINDAQVNYFKHDFNFLYCTGKGPGYMPTDKQSLEANVNGEIDLLDYMHGLNPDLFLNITSFLWLSPWWLPHANAVWIGSSDYGWNLTAPALNERDRTITYYDTWLYRHYHDDEEQFPLYALMTHGIIDARKNKLGGKDEKFTSWADNVMMYLGRGVMMRELYLTPGDVTPRQWELIGRALRWAGSRDRTFFNGEMQGGDPGRGEPYWFRFDDGAHEIFTFRNPGYNVRSIPLKLRHPGSAVRVVYPYHVWYDITRLNSRGEFEQQLGPHDVTIIESVPPEEIKRPIVQSLRSRLVRQTDTETEYEVGGVTGATRFFVQSGVKVNEVIFNGKTVEPEIGGGYIVDFPGKKDFWATQPLIVGASAAWATTAVNVEFASFVDDDLEDPKLVAIVRGGDDFVPSEVLLNGKPASATFQGVGWSGFEVPLEYGSHTTRIKLNADSVLHTPFATTSFTIDVQASGIFPVATTTVVLRHEPAPLDETVLPLASQQSFLRMVRPAVRSKHFDISRLLPARPPGGPDLSGIRAAKLRLRVFGSRPRGTPVSILLNGAPVGALPHNEFPHDLWQSFVIDIASANLAAIRADNKLTVLDISGETFKFGGAQLAVQLRNGDWISSNLMLGVLTDGKGWQYAEGKVFERKSPPVKLSF